MAEQEEKELEVKPLAPAAHRLNIEHCDHHHLHDTALSVEFQRRSNWNCIKCCGCLAALISIQAVVLIVLSFTVLRVRNPVLNITSEKITGMKLDSNSTLSPGTNLTVTASFSVKNPNVAAFKYFNATTSIYYDGVVVGQGRNPPGAAGAGKTLRMNATVEIMVDKLRGVPRLESDLRLGMLRMSSYTRISGRVKIMKIIKRDVVVKSNCTMAVNITSRAIQDLVCHRRISL